MKPKKSRKRRHSRVEWTTEKALAFRLPIIPLASFQPPHSLPSLDKHQHSTVLGNKEPTKNNIPDHTVHSNRNNETENTSESVDETRWEGELIRKESKINVSKKYRKSGVETIDPLSSPLLPIDLFYDDCLRVQPARALDLRGWRPGDNDMKFLCSIVNKYTNECTQQVTNNPESRSVAVQELLLEATKALTVEGIRTIACLKSLERLALAQFSPLSANVIGCFPSSLLHVDLQGCSGLSESGIKSLCSQCPHLESLSLKNCLEISNQYCWIISESISKRITYLNLSGCKLIDDNGVLCILLKLNALISFIGSNMPNVHGLCFQSLHAASSLQVIDLHETPLSFASLEGLMRGTSRNTESGRASNIYSLNLKECKDIGDESLKCLGQYCRTSLKSVQLKGCSSIGDEGLYQWFAQRDIGLDSFIEEELYEALLDEEEEDFQKNRASALEEINLNGCFRISTKGIEILARFAPHLVNLSINGLSHVREKGIEALSTYCLKLESLSFSGQLIKSQTRNLNITDTEPNERSHENSRSLKPECFYAMPCLSWRALKAITLMKRIRRLFLSHTQVDELALCKVLPSLIALDTLHLNSVATDLICTRIAQVYGAKSPEANLTDLDISSSLRVTYEGCYQLATSLSSLQTVNFSHCEEGVSNSVVVHLARHNRDLRVLKLAGNFQLQNDDVRAVFTYCTKLEKLSIERCPSVDEYVLRECCNKTNTLGKTLKFSKTFRGVVSTSGSVRDFHSRNVILNDASKVVGGWWRRYLQHKRQQALLRHRLRVINQAKLKIAILLQRRFRFCRLERNYTSARNYVKEYIFEWKRAACIRIQTFLKYSTIRLKYMRTKQALEEKKLKEERKKREALENRCSLEIQRVYRGYKGRQRAAERRRENIRIQNRRFFAAVSIQSRIYRGPNGRVLAQNRRNHKVINFFRRAMQIEREYAAVLLLSKLWRGILGRRDHKQRIIERNELEQLRHISSAKIQRVYRLYIMTTKFQKSLYDGALAMQRVVRGFFGRIRARKYLLRTQYTKLMPTLFTVKNSIFTREFVKQNLTSYRNATKIAEWSSRMFRGWQARVLVSFILSVKANFLFRVNESVCIIQRAMRKTLLAMQRERLRQLVILRNFSATKIQSVYRMWEAKCVALMLLLARNRRQSHQNFLDLTCKGGTQAWEKFLLTQIGSNYILVKWYRASLNLRGWVSQETIRIRHAMAKKIQAVFRGIVELARLFRGKLGRKIWREAIMEARKRRREQEEDNRAAVIARNVTNQYSVVQLHKEEKQVVIIQRFYRMLSHQHVWNREIDRLKKAHSKDCYENMELALRKQSECIIFQAKIWEEMLAKIKVPKVEEEQQLRDQKAKDTEKTHDDQVLYHLLVPHQKQFADDIVYYRKVKRLKERDTQRTLEDISKFSIQAKELAKSASRVAKENKRMKREIIRIQRLIRDFGIKLNDQLAFDPLLYPLDVQRCVTTLDEHWHFIFNRKVDPPTLYDYQSESYRAVQSYLEENYDRKDVGKFFKYVRNNYEEPESGSDDEDHHDDVNRISE